MNVVKEDLKKYRPGLVKADHSKPLTAEKLRKMPAGYPQVETPEDGSVYGAPGRSHTILGETITPESTAILPEMLSLKEASELTNLSYELLGFLCKKNKVNHIKSGNKYLINSFALAEYLNNAMGD